MEYKCAFFYLSQGTRFVAMRFKDVHLARYASLYTTSVILIIYYIFFLNWGKSIAWKIILKYWNCKFLEFSSKMQSKLWKLFLKWFIAAVLHSIYEIHFRLHGIFIEALKECPDNCFNFRDSSPKEVHMKETECWGSFKNDTRNNDQVIFGLPHPIFLPPSIITSLLNDTWFLLSKT